LLALALVRPIAAVSRALVEGLLGAGGGVSRRPPTERRRACRRALVLHGLGYLSLNAILIEQAYASELLVCMLSFSWIRGCDLRSGRTVARPAAGGARATRSGTAGHPICRRQG
jgi:hypothetical protein